MRESHRACILSPKAQIRIVHDQSPLLVARVAKVMACKGAVIEPPAIRYDGAALSSGHILVHLET